MSQPRTTEQTRRLIFFAGGGSIAGIGLLFTVYVLMTGSNGAGTAPEGTGPASTTPAGSQRVEQESGPATEPPPHGLIKEGTAGTTPMADSPQGGPVATTTPGPDPETTSSTTTASVPPSPTIEESREVRKITHFADAVHALAVSPSGQFAACAGGTERSGSSATPMIDLSFCVFDYTTGDLTQRLGAGKMPAWACAFRGPEQIVTGSHDGILRTSHIVSRQEVQMPGHTGRVYSVSVSPDGGYALSGGHDQMMRLWNLETGKEVQRYRGHAMMVLGVAFLPGGQRAISASHDKTLCVWDLASGLEIQRLSGHTGPVQSVAVSPDGRVAASGSSDGTIRIWNLETFKELFLLEGHKKPVRSVAFAPDGRHLLSGGGNEVWLWDVNARQPLCQLKGHQGEVTCVAFTPDGRQALSGSVDKTVRVWNLP